ncbi:MAG: glycine cleavage system aminomethyltransferase GcvT [Hyphomicrobiales bacterium]|nr:glycine cleavage system aminomethyltransferase GcvT [Hyphomicrobiales bacterium]MCP5371074.1 glycine cleavage system aminomethyltransferase GcvT [Hyphomicrobiales bacterium]
MTAPEDGHDGPDLKTTPLDALHRELGAKMVPFAGYAMPVQYEGIMAEHLHTRAAAGLFDVSHMGQALLTGADPAAAMETLVPGDIAGLAPGHTRYTLLTNDAGGIRDDLMVTRREGDLFLVVNAACKEADFAHIAGALAGRAELRPLDRALLALQGPAAAAVMARLAPALAQAAFMSFAEVELLGIPCFVTRSGYTGEDGYEISVPPDRAEDLARHLLDQDEVAPVGLGARDSLRLEAGLCLYGSDIDTTTTPIEAGLTWTIGQRRRAEGGFPGAEVILGQIAAGVARRRVGLRPDGRAPARAHTPVTDGAGTVIGEVTSGGFGPSVGGPVAMGYVATAQAKAGTPVAFQVRGKHLPGQVVKLPFTTHRYFKG